MLEIVLRKEKIPRSEPALSLAVAFTGAPAFRTGPAGIDRRHGDQPAAVPGQLIFQLTPQFCPALVEDGSIQAGLGPHLAPRTLHAASRRARHVAYPKILDAHNRVFFADRGRGFVQIIPTCIGYTDVKAGEPSLRSFPVLAELLFPAHGLLRFAQPCLNADENYSVVHRSSHRKGSPSGPPPCLCPPLWPIHGLALPPHALSES